MTGFDFSFRRRLPIVLQTEAAECGLACIAMVASFHGYETDLLSLRRHYSISLKGTTLEQLIDLAGRVELSARALRLGLPELAQLTRPAILHWDLNHFVVLKSVSHDKAEFHDPARGAVRLSFQEISKHFTGVALELTPTPKFTRKNEREQLPLRALWGQQAGLKGFLGQILALSLALEVFGILSPLFSQLVIDRVLLANDHRLLVVLGIGFVLLMLISTAVNTFRGWIVLYLSTHLNYQMLSRLLRHLLNLPLDYFTKRHIGDVVSRFGSLGAIQKALTTQFVASIVDGVMVVGTLGIMLVYSPMLTAITVTIVVLYGLVRWIAYGPLYRASYEQIIASAKQQTNFLETVRGIQGIRLFGAESLRHAEWQNLFTATINSGLRVSKLSIGFGLANGLVAGLGGIAIVWLGADQIMQGDFTVGMLFAFTAYSGQFSGKARALIGSYVTFRMLSLHSGRVADIALTEPEETANSVLLVPPQEISGELEVRDLGYRYGENEREVLSGITFSVPAAKCVVIVGRSGIGKSTLIKLMLGLMQPDEGAVLADGLEINRWGLKEYRKHVAGVMQDDQLFAGSLADNISFFDLRADEARIESCARLAMIHGEILAMPMGYHTLIGDMGTALSGGQKQRVLLARALYRQPKILFLDEATSHLDPELESRISVSIRNLKITRVIIAHRPETARFADQIVKLTANGAVIGTPKLTRPPAALVFDDNP